MNMMPFTKTILKNLFTKPVTNPYPQVQRVYPQRTRGHISVDMDVCILCGMCSRKCPADAIVVDREARTWSIERFGCIQCGYCVESCPKKCLKMLQSYTQPAAEKLTETFVKPPEPPKAPVPTESEKIAPIA